MAKRTSWLDSSSRSTVIDKQAQQLESFLKAMADGRVDDREIDEQEQRVVTLMKRIEPGLDDELHAQLTELLCELSAYNIMQTLYSLSESRPTSVFRG
jgi:hypothetical protein